MILLMWILECYFLVQYTYKVFQCHSNQDAVEQLQKSFPDSESAEQVNNMFWLLHNYNIREVYLLDTWEIYLSWSKVANSFLVNHYHITFFVRI